MNFVWQSGWLDHDVLWDNQPQFGTAVWRNVGAIAGDFEGFSVLLTAVLGKFFLS